jgi:hypothetical protein
MEMYPLPNVHVKPHTMGSTFMFYQLNLWDAFNISGDYMNKQESIVNDRKHTCSTVSPCTW